MGHYKTQDWWKDLSKALESFTEEELKKIDNQKVKAYHNAKVLGSYNSMSGVLSERASKGGKVRNVGKDKHHQSKAGKERAKNGGKEQLAGVRTKKSQSDGGKKTGAKNVETGHWTKCQEKALEIVTQKVKCPHCGLTSNYNIMKGKHFDKCKWLKIDKNKIIQLGLSGIKYGQIANQLDIKQWLVKKVMMEYKSQNS
jgi:hypothetical protein